MNAQVEEYSEAEDLGFLSDDIDLDVAADRSVERLRILSTLATTPGSSNISRDENRVEETNFDVGLTQSLTRADLIKIRDFLNGQDL